VLYLYWGLHFFDSCPRRSINQENITIRVTNTVVTRNTGGGAFIFIFTNCTICKWNIEISQVTLIENINGLSGLGGGLFVQIVGRRVSTAPTHYLRISNSVFQSGVAKIGGGAYIMVAITVADFDDIIVNETNQWMSILHSHFVGNTGLYGGGLAVSITYFPSSNLFHLNALVNTVYVENTTFTDNAAWSGSAVYITHSKLNTVAAAGLRQFIFENTSFHHNHLKINMSLFPKDATILGHKSTTLCTCKI